MKKKIYVVLLIALVFGLLLSGCENSTFSPAKEPANAKHTYNKVYNLNWATSQQINDPKVVNVWIPWTKWLEKESDGRLKIKFLAGESVLKAPEIYDGVVSKVVDMGDFFEALYPDRFLLNEVTTLPMIFDYPSIRATQKTANVLVKKYPSMMAEFKDVKLLGISAMGPSQLHTTKEQVKSMNNLEGMVVNTTGKYLLASVKALGASPVSYAPAEGYGMLAKGATDGILGDYEFIVNSGFLETLNYTTEVGNLGGKIMPIVMNIDVWNSLPTDLRELLAGKGIEYFLQAHALWMDQADMYKKKTIEVAYLKKNNTPIYVLPPEEKTKWVAVVKHVNDMWVADAQALGAPAEDILKDTMQLAKKYAYDTYPREKAIKIMKEISAFK